MNQSYQDKVYDFSKIQYNNYEKLDYKANKCPNPKN